MKILFVSMEYPPETGWGGIGAYVASLAPALVRRGHEVHVLSCVYGQKLRDYVDQGVYIHRRGQVRIPGLTRASRGAGLPNTVARFRYGLSSFFAYRGLTVGFDVIECADIRAEGWVFALFRTAPLVIHLHTPQVVVLACEQNGLPRDRDARWASRFEQFPVLRADAVTSPSGLLIERLTNIGWLRERRVEIIPNPIDWPRWRSVLPTAHAPPRVLFVGRLEPRKAPELLVQAMSIIRNKVPSAEAYFLGENCWRNGVPYLSWIEKTVADMSGCHFVGHVSRNEIACYLDAARVLVMPSWFENYPMAVLEAMAAGRPVVVTEVTGVAKLIENTGGGRVIRPGDPKALAESLVPFLLDADHASDVGNRARVTVRESLDPDKIAAQREIVYRQAISSSLKGRRR
jgi:glycogen synthase